MEPIKKSEKMLMKCLTEISEMSVGITGMLEYVISDVFNL
jgi:hypothetical protein